MIIRNPNTFGKDSGVRSVRQTASVPVSTLLATAPMLSTESVSEPTAEVVTAVEPEISIEPIRPTGVPIEQPLKQPEAASIDLEPGRYWSHGVLIVVGADGVNVKPEPNKPQDAIKYTHTEALRVGGDTGVIVSIVPAQTPANQEDAVQTEVPNAIETGIITGSQEELTKTESEVERG
jgi:hypothetical protein